MICTHDVTEREVAAVADGMCPLCLGARLDEATLLLALLFDMWEGGIPCYEADPDGHVVEDGYYIGNAFKLSSEEEDRIVAFLGPEPLRRKNETHRER